MGVFVAFLRAVNVGGTGKLPMADLRRLCEDLGFERVTTYIQSGNVVFHSKLGKARVQRELADALAADMGKPVGVHVRTAGELEAVLRSSPFTHAAPNRVIVFFLEKAPPPRALAGITIPGREEVEAVGAHVLVHYPDGQGRSKLKLPFAASGTGRNLNTVRKMLDLARGGERG
jgi:uncharacterized protein (DUF1697 family)